MFLVNFFELNRPWIFFLQKEKKFERKKKRDFLIRKTRTKRKKKLTAAVIGFLSFFRPVFFFLNIFQLLKKLSQLLCCFKDFLRESGKKINLIKKKFEGRARYGQGLGDFIKHSSSQLFNDF